MDSAVFDSLARLVSERLTRRRLAGIAGVGVVATAAAPVLADAKKRQKKQAGAEHNVRGNKVIMCIDGETRRVSKDKRKKYLKQAATRGKCQNSCTPVCPAGSCNIDDGCGGTCPGCPSGQVCAEGVCQACLVSCDAATETPAECGDTLRDALLTGGNIYVCPGVYEGTFVPLVSTNIYGAGNGTDNPTNTILTGSDSTQIMDIEASITVKLSSLRFTNGNATHGGGIYMRGKAVDVTVTDCVFTEGDGEYGAGIYAEEGTLDITDCQFIDNNDDYDGAGLFVYYATVAVTDSVFTRNHADGDGGAIYVYDALSSTTVTGCTITHNYAADYGGGIASEGGPITITNTEITKNISEEYGGGIYNNGGVVTLADSVSITGNDVQSPAPSGGGVYISGGTFNRNSATISGNTSDQCIGTGC